MKVLPARLLKGLLLFLPKRHIPVDSLIEITPNIWHQLESQRVELAVSEFLTLPDQMRNLSLSRDDRLYSLSRY